MPAPRRKRNQTTVDNSYSKLEEYCIWLNEYYRALRKSGFSTDMAYWIMTNKESYPAWVSFRLPTEDDIIQFMEDEDE